MSPHINYSADITLAFKTYQTDAGTSVVVESFEDTITFTSADGSVLITGNSSTDTIDFSSAGNFTFRTIVGTTGTNPVADALADTLTFADSGNFVIITGDSATDTLTFSAGTNVTLLAGRSGGQILIGGTGSGDDLTLNSTSHATKGSIFLGSSTGLVYDEVTDRVGIGTDSPASTLHVLNSTVSSSVIHESQSDTIPPFITIRRGRASNASLADGDDVGRISYHSRHNSTNQGIGSIGAIYRGDGTTRTGDLYFETSNAGSPTERMRILSTGYIGIGNANPGHLLTIAADGTTIGTNEQISLRSQRVAIVNGSLIGGLSFRSNDTNLTAPGSIVGLFSMIGSESHTATALGSHFVWYTTEGTTTTMSEAMRLTDFGALQIGTTSSVYQFLVQTDDNGSAAAFIINATSANVTTADELIAFRSSQGVIGNITGTAVAGTIIYNTFTGGHYSQSFLIPTIKEEKFNSRGIQKDEYHCDLVPGSILISTDEMCEWQDEPNLTLPKCDVSSIKEDKRVYGVYGGHDPDGDIIVMALGSGIIRVCDEGGYIEVGDFLCSSSTPGVAMLYSGNDMRVVIAKARQSFNGKDGTIACTLMCG